MVRVARRHLISLLAGCLGLLLQVESGIAQDITTPITLTNVWRYNDSGVDLGTNWRQPDFDDSAWPSGMGLLGFEPDTPSVYTLHAPISTPLTVSLTRTTFYFRTTFDFSGPTNGLTLIATNLVDDGCAIYLNGASVGGVRAPTNFNATTFFLGGTEGQFDVVTFTNLNALRQGNNVIAVEVHQGSSASTDIMWGMKLMAVRFGEPPVQGTVLAWGDNTSGQSTVPVEALSEVVALAAGDAHSLALKADGTVVAWGGNISGQASVPTNLASVGAIAAGGYHNLALKQDGTVFAWGYNGQGQTGVPSNLTNVIAVAAGGFHSLALKKDGTVAAWGYDQWGQSTTPANLTGVVAIAAGYYYNLALKGDGTVVAWGRNTEGEGAVPTNLNRVTAIAAGNFHNLALKDDGTVIAWGRNHYGETSVPAGLTRVTTIEAGSFHSLALKSDRTVVAWGNNDYGQGAAPQDIGAVNAIAAGGYHNLVLIGDQSPFLVREPSSQTVAVGAAVLFEVGVGGTAPLQYQWRKDDANLTEQTNASLVIGHVQLRDAGGYSVVASNALGSVTSKVAQLTVGYSLSVRVSGQGSVSVTPDRSIFDPGSSVTLTARPSTTNLHFSWSGDASGSQNPLTLTMDTNKSVVAEFVPGYTVTVAVIGSGTATITPLRSLYIPGEMIQIAATPSRWYTFTRWSDGITDNPRAVIIGASNTYSAIFSPTTAVETLTFGNVSRTAPVGMPAFFVDGEFVVTNEVSHLDAATVSMLTTFPNGSIFYTLDGGTPDFGSTLCTGPVLLRRSATIRAVAYDASFLKSWEGDPVQVIIEPTFAVNATTPGGGTVSVLPTAASYRSNALVTLRATPAPGWTFLQWLGDAAGTNSTTSVRVMNRDLCAQALFGTTLSTAVAGNGSVAMSPVAVLYPYGTVAWLTAVPQDGNYFGAWGNAAMSTNNPHLFPVTNAHPTVSCAFGALSAGQVAFTVLVNGRGRVTTSPRGNRFSNGQSVRLTATADADQEFTGWTGDATSATTNLTVVLTQSKVITANFTKRPQLALGPCLGGWHEDGFQLTITGEMGGRYRIELSSGLADWSLLSSFTNTYGVWQMIDTSATNGAIRFYRAVEEP